MTATLDVTTAAATHFNNVTIQFQLIIIGQGRL